MRCEVEGRALAIPDGAGFQLNPAPVLSDYSVLPTFGDGAPAAEDRGPIGRALPEK